MRTNIDINDQLLREAKRLTKIDTKKELVEQALIELINLWKRKDLASLRGKVKWEGNISKMRTD